MSRFMKLLMRIKAMSKDMRFEEVRKVLETYGYKMNFKDMSPGMKELYKLLLEGKMIHGGTLVLK